MKSIFIPVLTLIAKEVNGHLPIDCFVTGPIIGAQGNPDSEIVESSDLDLLKNLGPDQILTSIKVCTDRAVTYIKGIQASYGEFN